MSNIEFIVAVSFLNSLFLIYISCKVFKIARLLLSDRTLAKINMLYKMATFAEEKYGLRDERWESERLGDKF